MLVYGVEERCDFCGKYTFTEGTATVGCYCIECHQLVREQSSVAIRLIRERKRSKGGSGESKNASSI